MLQLLHNPARASRWVLAALCETAAATPWLIFLVAADGVSDWHQALPGGWLLPAAYLSAAAWEAGAPRNSTSPQSRVLALAAGTALVYAVTYYSMPAMFRAGGPFQGGPAAAVVPVAAFVWYQGAAAAARGLEFARTFARLGRQALMMGLGLLILVGIGFAAEARIQVLLYWNVVLLFAAGLILLSVTRERALRTGQKELGEAGSGSTRLSAAVNWVVLVLVTLTVAAARTLSVDRLLTTFSMIAAWISRPLDWLVSVVMLIVFRWIVLFDLILGLFRKLLGAPAKTEPQSTPGLVPLPALPQDLPVAIIAAGQAERYMKAIFVALAVLIAAVMAYRLARGRTEAWAQGDEERISLGFWRGVIGDLRAWLSGSFSKPDPVPSTALVPEVTLDPRDPRALFRRLQDWGATVGRPRRTQETPNAFAVSLSLRLPDAAAAVSAVAFVYNELRYGESLPSDEAVTEAAVAMEHLENNPAR